MADLNIHVEVVAGKTVSGFGVMPGAKINVYNHGTEELTIGLKPNVFASPPFCSGPNDNGPIWSFKVKADKHEGVYVCNSFPEKQFGYTAQIGQSGLEDPIIIIGRDSPVPWIAANGLGLAIGTALGIVLTLVALRLFGKQRPT